MLSKEYNRFERAFELMVELIKAPMPLESAELANISDRELAFLKDSIKLMAEYLNSLGCLVWHDDEVIWQIEEIEQERAER